MMRIDGDGHRVKYYEVKLENVLIGDMEQIVAEGRILRDHIALHFTKAKRKYSQQKNRWRHGRPHGWWLGPLVAMHKRD